MSRQDRRLLALSLPVTLILVGATAALFAQSVPSYPVDSALPRFDADRALAAARQLATDYPDRVVGSETGRRARGWLIRRFSEMGLPVEALPFTVTIASELYNGSQVWAVSPGVAGDARRDEIILVTAHYDVPRTGIPGAADDASGIGTLLELARLFAAEPHQRTFIFMASDSEEYGSFWGAKNFVENFPAKDKIVAVLDLDYLSARELKRINLSSVGLRRGYTPLWLRQVGLGAIESAGTEAGEADGIFEYLYRAVPIGAADYAAYLRAGVAAVNFGGEPTDAANWLAEYHTPLDTPDKLTASAFAAYGRAAETFVRTVDALDAVPANEQHYFRLSRAHFLPGAAVSGLQLLLFAPLFLATYLAWRSARPRWGDLQPELTALMGLLITGLDGYAIAFSLARLGLLPRYEMFPANPRDPFLLEPTAWAVFVIYGGMAWFGWLTFRPFGGWARLADLLRLPHRRLTLLLVFSALVVALWPLNGFAVSGLLGPAAYAWIWIEPHERLWRKMLNLGLALVGLLPFAAVVAFFASNFPIGPWWWYLTLAAAYGLFPPLAVVAFFVGAALLVRFIRHGFRDE